MMMRPRFMDKRSMAKLQAGNPALNNGVNARLAAGLEAQALPRVLVVFSARTELVWLKVLRPGFRHCFVLVEYLNGELGGETGGGRQGEGERAWVLYNPLSNGTQLAVWAGVNAADLQEGLRQQGYLVVETYARPISARLYGWRPFTCVEAVKRVLGLHAPGVFTPWQLYRVLKKCKNRKIVLDYGG